MRHFIYKIVGIDCGGYDKIMQKSEKGTTSEGNFHLSIFVKICDNHIVTDKFKSLIFCP